MGESNPRTRNANAVHYHYANGPVRIKNSKYKVKSLQFYF